MLELFLGILIGIIVGGSGGALGMSVYKDQWFASLPPKTMEVYHEVTVTVDSKAIAKTETRVETSVYQFPEKVFGFVFTNDDGVTNWVQSVITNTNSNRTWTNVVTNAGMNFKR